MAIYAIIAIPFSFYGLVAVMYYIYDKLDDFWPTIWSFKYFTFKSFYAERLRIDYFI